MALRSIFNSAFISGLAFHSSSSSSVNFLSLSHVSADLISVNGSKKCKTGGGGRAKFNKIGVVSSHSNPKILKSKHKSRYGQPISPYDTDEDDDDCGGVDVENEDDDCFSDVGFSRSSFFCCFMDVNIRFWVFFPFSNIFLISFSVLSNVRW